MEKVGKRIIDALNESLLLDPQLVRFQAESNRIEGIKVVRAREVEALATLIASPHLWIGELAAYVSVCQPNAALRDEPSVPGVRVGDHIAPPSGPRLMMDLNMLLDRVNGNAAPITPWEAHCQYEDRSRT